jgi:hypothetical protein
MLMLKASLDQLIFVKLGKDRLVDEVTEEPMESLVAVLHGNPIKKSL